MESELGVGSVFRIYIPAATKVQSQKRTIKEKPIPGQGKVLVMDDEEILRDFVGELLEVLGYKVYFACDGTETIDLYLKAKEIGDPFDCVLMDLTIPGGMGGKETIQKLREIDPNVKAIVSSGYSDDPVMADFKNHGFCGLLQTYEC